MVKPRLLFTLRPPAAVVRGGKALRVRLGNETITFPGSSRLRRALRRLESGASDDELVEIVGRDNLEALATWYYCLGMLERHGAVDYEARHDGVVFTRAVVASPYFIGSAGVLSLTDRFVLSRFAYVRRSGDQFLLESPLTCARIELLQPIAFTMLASFNKPKCILEAAEDVGGDYLQAVADFVAVLEYCGMLSRHSLTDSTEAATPALQTWNFADLLFHGRSRGGRHDEAFDRFCFLGTLPSLPAVKPPMSEETIELYAPDLRDLAENDVSFSRVLEDRRSLRSYDASPITVRQLGEYLYRVARIKRLIEPDGRSILYQASSRPYPGAGACYELEIYVVVNLCAGLANGLYHYDPLRHNLEVIDGGESLVASFMRDTFVPVETEGERQILFVVAARFQRISWKYSGSQYATILKDVGVLFQTMYLVATAMNLAPCAIGGGNSELFSRAIGAAFHEETSVGEFMLGTRPGSG